MYPTTPSVPPPNPLQLVSGYASAKGALIQNQLLQQEQLGNQAIANALQEAIDPDTGDLNQSKYARALGRTIGGTGAGQQGINSLNSTLSYNAPVPFNVEETNAATGLPKGTYRQGQAPTSEVLRLGGGGQSDGGTSSSLSTLVNQSAQLTEDQNGNLVSDGQPGNSLTGGNQPPNALMGNAPVAQPKPGQVGPPAPPSQSDIDGVHTHIDGVIKALTPLASDPNISEKKIMNATIGAMNDPTIKFNAQDAATLLSKLPPNATPQQLQTLVQQTLKNQTQMQSAFAQKYPSSAMIAQRQQQPQTGAPGAAQPSGAPNVPPAGNNFLAPQSRTQQLGTSQPPATNPTAQSAGTTVVAGQQQPMAQVSTQAQSSVPGTLTAPPTGAPQVAEEAITHRAAVRNAAQSEIVPVAALGNVISLANQAPDAGTFLGKLYQDAVAHNVPGIVPGLDPKQGQTLQQLQMHEAQILSELGFPGTDKSLQAMQAGSLSADSFQSTIKSFGPFLQAIRTMPIDQNNYYERMTHGDPRDVNSINAARTEWINNASPIAKEFISGNDQQKQEVLSRIPTEELPAFNQKVAWWKNNVAKPRQ
jgi:hypothetical protein